MFEPKVLTDLSMLPKVVETNLGELDATISERISQADSLVVTNDEADVAAADKGASELTKMADRVKRFRIDFVAWWKKPLEGVEAKCKDYEKRLSEAAHALRDKTAEVKAIWNDQKIGALSAIWVDRLNERFDDAAVLNSPHWEAFFSAWTDPKAKGSWLNKGVSINAAEKQMLAEIERVENGIATLHETLCTESTEIQTIAMREYCVDFCTEDSLRAVYRYKAEQEAIAQAKAAQSASMGGSATGSINTQAEAANAVQTTSDASVRVLSEEPIDLMTYRLSVTGTKESLIGMRDYCRENGIKVVNLDRVVKG